MRLADLKISYRRLCMLLDLAMLLIMASFVVYALVHTPKSHYDVDRTTYPVKGIDISAHNGEIDFMRAMADSVSFVFIKATEGTDFCDAKFAINYERARCTGLKVGAYHFFRFDTPGNVQARHFLTSVNGLILDMPLVIDVEKWGNTQQYDTDDVKVNLRMMTDVLQAAGYPVMIYTNQQGYNTFIEDDFDDIQLWICALSHPPVTDRWTLWQHTHTDRVDGLTGNVDANTFNGDANEFRKWAKSYNINIPPGADRQ